MEHPHQSDQRTVSKTWRWVFHFRAVVRLKALPAVAVKSNSPFCHRQKHNSTRCGPLGAKKASILLQSDGMRRDRREEASETLAIRIPSCPIRHLRYRISQISSCLSIGSCTTCCGVADRLSKTASKLGRSARCERRAYILRQFVGPTRKPSESRPSTALHQSSGRTRPSSRGGVGRMIPH